MLNFVATGVQVGDHRGANTTFDRTPGPMCTSLNSFVEVTP